jgi:hypothetical protein
MAISFSDTEMDLIRASAAPLPPWQRGAFLHAVVVALEGQPVGAGTVHRACVEQQRAFLNGNHPDLSSRRGQGKYR